MTRIIMGSLTLTLMSFGLTTVIDSDMGSAISMILTGLFVLVINVVSGQGANLKKLVGMMGQKSAAAKEI